MRLYSSKLLGAKSGSPSARLYTFSSVRAFSKIAEALSVSPQIININAKMLQVFIVYPNLSESSFKLLIIYSYELTGALGSCRDIQHWQSTTRQLSSSTCFSVSNVFWAKSILSIWRYAQSFTARLQRNKREVKKLTIRGFWFQSRVGIGCCTAYQSNSGIQEQSLIFDSQVIFMFLGSLPTSHALSAHNLCRFSKRLIRYQVNLPSMPNIELKH